MQHLEDDDLILIYYGEEARPAHLEACAECAARYAALTADLPLLAAEMPVPERGAEYGQWTWHRLQPKLATTSANTISIRKRPGWIAAAIATAAMLILGAFFAGRYTMQHELGHDGQQQPLTADAAKAGARLFRASLGDHLERSQLVLREIENAPVTQTDFADEKERAESLLTPNRLYRQEAELDGDRETADVLEDLERILLEVARQPAGVSAEELGAIRDRIRAQRISFRIKVEEVQQEVLQQ